MTDATSQYLNRPLRSLDQKTGANVIKGPWPCEAGAPTPRVLVEGQPKLPLETLWEMYVEEVLRVLSELKK